MRGLIVPFRYRKSAKNYAKIWTKEGSPLVVHSQKLANEVETKLGCPTAIGMRYGSPSIEEGLKALQAKQIKKLVLVPLFPQYAAATTTSAFEEAMRHLSTWPTIPHIHCLSGFASNPQFLDAWAKVGSTFPLSQYDHILFSFHGLPERHNKKAIKKNYLCYKEQCYATAGGIASRLSLPQESYSICFQSRLGVDAWLKPYTSKTIEQLAQKGCKKLCVFAPSFVADCLETIYEIALEYQEEFAHLGGEKIDLVPSLNTHPDWIQALTQMIKASVKT